MDYVLRELACEKDLRAKRSLSLPVRPRSRWIRCATLTNHFTGKMGYAVARACMLRGADVTLLASTGCTLPPVPFVKHSALHHRG